MSDDVMVALVLGSVFTLSGIVSCMVGVYQILRSQRLRREGLTATATVVNRRVDEQHSRSSSGGRSTTRWFHVTLRWTGADGQPVHGENVLPNAKRYEALPEGTEVQVRYLPRRRGATRASVSTSSSSTRARANAMASGVSSGRSSAWAPAALCSPGGCRRWRSEGLCGQAHSTLDD